MQRYVLVVLAVLVLVCASLIPDDAFARGGGRGGGGFRGGGFHGGGMRAGGYHGGARFAGGYRGGVGGGRYAAVGGRGYGYRPAARAAVRGGAYRYAGAGYRYGAWRGAAVGAAAVGAAAAGAYGAYGYYNNQCYRDTYGNLVCPGQYPY
ncbi:hypothetical protein [Bradyrhizobium sp. Tv2a-2]|uniref:hypothetical protein n=1 Tax=Bradyrhizobium sp. Tv2a-2 TaxID=113395 RepID=UPI0004076A6C|nr:hypothetical protein [Bradyrhizobium sp. Tv2a-2]